MENEEKKPLSGGTSGEFSPDQVPEPLRGLLKARMDAAKSGETPDVSRLEFKKNLQFQFQGGSPLGMLLKLLVNASLPAKPRPPAQPRTAAGAGAPEERPLIQNESYRPGAVKPSSSGWLVWLIAAILALAYLVSSRALGR